jgi:hypothetical protein
MEIRKIFDTTERLVELINNIHSIDVASKDKKKSIPIQNIEWVSPISILPVVVYAKTKRLKIDYLTEDEDVRSYLGTICFPDGTKVLSDIGTRYLPITRISCGLENSLLSNYEDG